MSPSLLYLGTNGYVAALDPRTGEEVWRTKLGTSLFSATSSQDVTVLEHEGRIFAGCYGHLFCLDGRSGELQWHNELSGLGHNDIALSIDGRSAQTVRTVQRQG